MKEYLFNKIKNFTQRSYNENFKLVVKKIQIWDYLLNSLNYPLTKENPNIQAIRFFIKLVVYFGIIESLVKKQADSKQKILYVFDKLSKYEKFLISQSILITKREMELGYSPKVAIFYLKPNKNHLENQFKRRISFLYGFRSELVHKGEYPTGALIGDHFLFILGKSKEKIKNFRRFIKIKEDLISLDEMLLISVCRFYKISLRDIENEVKKRIRNFLLKNNYMDQHS